MGEGGRSSRLAACSGANGKQRIFSENNLRNRLIARHLRAAAVGGAFWLRSLARVSCNFGRARGFFWWFADVVTS
jgi:hypothetical protein